MCICVCACAQVCLCVALAVLHKAPSKKHRVVGSRTQSLFNRPFFAELTLPYWAFCHGDTHTHTCTHIHAHTHADRFTASSDNEPLVNHSKSYKRSCNQTQTFKEHRKNVHAHWWDAVKHRNRDHVCAHAHSQTKLEWCHLRADCENSQLLIRSVSEGLCTRVSGKWVVLIHCGSMCDDFVTSSSTALSPLTFGLHKGFGWSAVIHTFLMCFFFLNLWQILRSSVKNAF